ncbi:MAG: hypothetical protein JJU33_05145 [Phycisphaerales bacterium]|nr:hypothetical protein [Phycisphaerales bacterium]
MRLTDSNIVLLGGFNPHIIEPSWLSRHDVVEEKSDEFMTEIQFGPSAPQMLRFNLDGLRWEVTLDRVLVGSSETRSPAEWLIRLLDLLPHTPLRAVGINFKLRSERTEWPIDLPTLPNQEAIQSLIGEVVTSTAVTRGRLENGTQMSLMLNATQAEVVLDANFHRGVFNSGEMSAMEMAKQAMTEFDGDWSRLRDIVSKMTGKEVG